MLMIVFTLALIAGSTQLSTIADFMASSEVGPARVAGAGAGRARSWWRSPRTRRIPVDNPATHLELTMVHEAMVLEYSGRHLAMIELAASLKLLLYISLIACMFVPWGLAPPADRGRRYVAVGVAAYLVKLAVGGVLLAVFETVDRQDAGVPRAGLPRRGADAGPARRAAAVRVARLLMRGRSPSTSRICWPAAWCW